VFIVVVVDATNVEDPAIRTENSRAESVAKQRSLGIGLLELRNVSTNRTKLGATKCTVEIIHERTDEGCPRTTWWWTTTDRV